MRKRGIREVISECRNTDSKQGQSALKVGSLSYSSVRQIAYTSGAYVGSSLFLPDSDVKSGISFCMFQR